MSQRLQADHLHNHNRKSRGWAGERLEVGLTEAGRGRCDPGQSPRRLIEKRDCSRYRAAIGMTRREDVLHVDAPFMVNLRGHIASLRTVPTDICS